MTKNAAADIKKLGPPAQRRIYDYLRTRISALQDPRQHGKQLRVVTPKTFWRYHIDPYRIICQINKDKETSVLVVKAGHRETVYLRP